MLQNKDESVINIKYIYYYLYNNLELFKNYYTGVAIKNISKSNIQKIKIPTPSLEQQNKIVKSLEEIENLNKELENKMKINKQKAKSIIDNL